MIRSVAAVLARGVRSMAATLPDLLRDLAGIGAVVLIAYGCWLIYQPAGFIAAGILILAGVLASASRSRAQGG